MRVLLLCCDHGVPLGGPKGCSVHLRSVATALRRLGHAVAIRVVEAGTSNDSPALEADGIDVGALRMPVGVETLRAEMRGLRPDLVLERLALGPPVGAQAAAALRVRHLFEVNAPLDQEAAAYRGLSDSGQARGELAQGFSLSSGAVAVSDEVAGWLKALAPEGFAVTVVPNGADPSFLEDPDAASVARARRELGVREGDFQVAFLGSFKPWHDLDGLVRSVALLRQRLEARLVMIGDGPLRNQVLAAATAQRVPTMLTGHVPHHEVPAYLSLCQAMAVPYALADAYFSPLKLIEGMAVGLPVVASATGPCARLVRDDVDGLLVPPDDPPALAAALERLARSPTLRQRLGAAARQRVRSEYTWDRVVERILGFAVDGLRATPSRMRGAGRA